MATKTAQAGFRMSGFNPVRRLRSWGVPTGLLGLGFVLAAGVTLWGILLAPRGAANGSILLILIMLGANMALILSLAGVVGWRAFKLIDAGDAGAKLRARFVWQFALAAVTPALVIALFFSMMVTRGIDQWFTAEVRTMVDSANRTAATYIDGEKSRISAEIGSMAGILDRNAALLRTAPVSFNQILNQQVESRRLAAAYIIDSRGTVLARVEKKLAPPFAAPTQRDFASAGGDIAQLSDSRAPNAFLLLYRLKDVPDAYLYVAWPLYDGMLEALPKIKNARDSYLQGEANRSRIKAAFFLAYVETTLLVLAGAVWLGMAAAAVVTAPIGRLVQAAGRVSGGDLSARVDADSDPEEISVLSHAFNRMTHDLRVQQDALRAAGEDADRRRQFMETVLSGVSAGVVGLDSVQRISAINQPAARLLGMDERHALGLPLADGAPELAAVVAEALESDTHPEEEVDITRGGETRRLRVRVSSLADEGLVLTFDDITRLAAAQRNAAWKDVARRIAHEIKNPLTPIQLSAERIRRRYRKDITGDDLETFDRCTDTIIRQVGDIGRMVDEFSAFARMPTPRFSHNDAAELLRQTVFAQRVASPELIVEILEPLPEAVLICDRQMVSQALANVLKNAAEAVSARLALQPDPPGRIVASLVISGPTLVIDIEDNGVGLPSKNREQLTEPYVTTRDKGTGLGLAIVKRIVEDHRGELVLADAKEGQGARAMLRFPLTNQNQSQGPEAAQLAS